MTSWFDSPMVELIKSDELFKLYKNADFHTYIVLKSDRACVWPKLLV